MPRNQTVSRLQCSSCCTSLDAKEALYYRDDAYCSQCFYDAYGYCSRCEDAYHNDDLHTGLDGEALCTHCYNELYFICDVCHDAARREDVNFVQRQEICNDCYNELYTICDYCSDPFRREDAYSLYDYDYLCEDCYYTLSQRAIKPYSYKPDPQFVVYDKKNGKKMISRRPLLLFLGVELEVENQTKDYDTNVVASDLIESYGLKDFYLKYDGSLVDGFEIVTEPMTLQGHKALKWRDILDFLTSRGFRSWDSGNCGLHIHVNRSQFLSQDHYKGLALYELKIAALFLRIGRDLKTWSGRRDFNYCQFPQVGGGNVIDEILGIANTIKNHRHYAITTTPRNTIEFRFPRGTLNFGNLIGSLELVATLVEIVNRYGLVYIATILSRQDVIRIARENQYKYVEKMIKSREG